MNEMLALFSIITFMILQLEQTDIVGELIRETNLLTKRPCTCLLNCEFLFTLRTAVG